MHGKAGPLVSVIILNYNAREYLDGCLRSVLNSNYDNLEVILVDNASTDGSVEFVLERFGNSGIKVIRLKRNYGFSIGNNKGAEYATGKYLVFLNPDTEVDPDWLGPLVEVMEKNPDIGVAQPLVLMSDGKHVDSAGCWINPYGLVFTLGHGREDGKHYTGVYDIFYAKGCALMIRREVWERLGGFCPLFFTYYEETDLCWRVWRLGYRVVCVPESVIYHAGGGTLKKVPFHVKYHEARGRIAVLIRNHTFFNVMKYVPVTLLLHVLNIARYVLKREVKAAWAIIKGTFWALRNFRRIWASRVEFPRDDLALKAMMKHPVFWRA